MNITKEEVQQVLGALHADPHTADWDDAIALLQSKLAEPAHTDHPMRHHDRTCPACQDAEPVGWFMDVTTDGKSTGDFQLAAKEYWGDRSVCTPLFTHPAKQVPEEITFEQIHERFMEELSKFRIKS